ncbi:lipid A biosynthesis acyltransferase [Hydrogenophaga sp.]|uniref:LpxL/LpxP family acyltransferase n=1 Tax=Hydrogenophaga sp. TaxID=1904254 RepID=UPI00356ACAAA
MTPTRLHALRHFVAHNWGNRLGLAWMRLLARCPLPLVRGLGWIMGRVLHAVAARRRRIARINWALCFPEQTEAERQRAVRRHFVLFAQAWLDRSWIWEGREAVVRQRLKLVGDLDALSGDEPTVLFAPHFVGMDAGWTALTVHVQRRFCGIYARQLNAGVDHWMSAGRQRFGDPHIVAKSEGLKPLVAALRAGEPLYLLPDMDYGPRDSVFVPFFGVNTATVPSLSRFARMGRARVVAVVSRLTPQGYEVEIRSPWSGFPSDDATADTAAMNRALETMIATMPEQYYWVHKRFKTRPAGEASVYGRD